MKLNGAMAKPLLRACRAGYTWCFNDGKIRFTDNRPNVERRMPTLEIPLWVDTETAGAILAGHLDDIPEGMCTNCQRRVEA